MAFASNGKQRDGVVHIKRIRDNIQNRTHGKNPQKKYALPNPQQVGCQETAKDEQIGPQAVLPLELREEEAFLLLVDDGPFSVPPRRRGCMVDAKPHGSPNQEEHIQRQKHSQQGIRNGDRHVGTSVRLETLTTLIEMPLSTFEGGWALSSVERSSRYRGWRGRPYVDRMHPDFVELAL